MNLITARLLIRSLQVEDTADLAAIWSDQEVTRFMGGPRDYAQTGKRMCVYLREFNRSSQR